VIRGALDIEGLGVQAHTSASSRSLVQQALWRTLSKATSAFGGLSSFVKKQRWSNETANKPLISKLELRIRRPCTADGMPCQLVRLAFEAQVACYWPQDDNFQWEELQSKTQVFARYLPSHLVSELTSAVCRKNEVWRKRRSCHRSSQLCHWCAPGAKRWRASLHAEHQNVEWFVQLASSRCTSPSATLDMESWRIFYFALFGCTWRSAIFDMELWRIFYFAFFGLAHALLRVYYFWWLKQPQTPSSGQEDEEEDEVEEEDKEYEQDKWHEEYEKHEEMEQKEEDEEQNKNEDEDEDREAPTLCWGWSTQAFEPDNSCEEVGLGADEKKLQKHDHEEVEEDKDEELALELHEDMDEKEVGLSSDEKKLHKNEDDEVEEDQDEERKVELHEDVDLSLSNMPSAATTSPSEHGASEFLPGDDGTRQQIDTCAEEVSTAVKRPTRRGRKKRKAKAEANVE